MIVQHQQKQPQIDPSSFIAPNAMICGDVRIGKNVRVMYGAQLIAESSPITIGDNCIILENAVIRGTDNYSVTIGANCLIGPQTHLAGCILEDNVFVATGAAVFHGAVLQSGSEVRINAVVHLKSVLASGVSVPIGWVAVGDPAQLFSPDRHDEIWAIQRTLRFPQTVYGIDASQSDNPMKDICGVMSNRLKSHMNDVLV